MNDRLAKSGSNLRDRVFEFAVAAVRLHREVHRSDTTLRDVSRQFVKAATSIGANLEEADAAQSRADFVSKCTISLKEAREAHYWTRLIARTADDQSRAVAMKLAAEADQLVAILTTIVRRSRENDVVRDAPADDDLSILNSQFSIPDHE